MNEQRQVLVDHYRQPLEEIKLTEHEREVLPYLAQGLLYKQIAGELGITQEAAQGRVKNIIKKAKRKGYCFGRVLVRARQ